MNTLTQVVSLLAEIRDQNAEILEELCDLNKYAAMRERNRIRMQETRANSRNAVRAQASVHAQEENESGKETLSPTPPYREKGKEKEKQQPRHTRAHAHAHGDEIVSEEIPIGTFDVHKPPTLEDLLAFAHQKAHFFDDDFTRMFYQSVGVECGWKNSTGSEINNWANYFRVWRENRAMFERMRDPERIADARKAGASPANRREEAFERQRRENEERDREFGKRALAVAEELIVKSKNV